MDPKALTPGTKMRYENGATVILRCRKDDDSGWWLEDGSGLADKVLDGTWTGGAMRWSVAVVEDAPPSDLCPSCGGTGRVTGPIGPEDTVDNR